MALHLSFGHLQLKLWAKERTGVKLRPLKVENRPFPDVCRWNVMGRWKALEESYKFGLDLTPIAGWGQEL